MRFEEQPPTEHDTLPPVSNAVLNPVPASTDWTARLLGQTLVQYELSEIIAKGQSGVVFRGRDIKDNRSVAVKVLPPGFPRDEEEAHRFVRAMKTMLPLRHPNLVMLYGAGKTGPYCWIAMELIDGESLTQVIQRIGIAGMLDWRHALRVGIHIGRALDFAHRQHIIHRNVAPANILIQNSDKTAKLGDLMLAKALEGAMAQQITRPGEILGEVRYMSPERTHGGSTDVDHRSDLYSLGATIFALLTGRPPFSADSLVETILKIRQETPEKPKKFQLSIPDLFEGAVLKLLAKRPDFRFQSAAELVVVLEKVAKFQGLTI
jgi:serine/threonine-protein kinase